MTKRHPSGSNREAGWSAATWEGARREQMRRWAALPLEQAILALEEMEELARALRAAPAPESALAGRPVPMTPGVAEHAAESRDTTDEARKRQGHR